MKRHMRSPMVALMIVGYAGAAHAIEKPCAATVDSDNNGYPDFNTAYVYQGSVLRRETTYPIGFSSPSEDVWYVYDRLGRIWGKAVDTNGDGAPEREFYYAYQADGRLYAEGIDDGPDGTLDQITAYSYNGNTRYAAVDLRADGTINRMEKLTSYYDASGLLTRQVLEVGGGTAYRQITLFVYDDGGNLATREVDRDSNGTIDEVTLYKFQC